MQKEHRNFSKRLEIFRYLCEHSCNCEALFKPVKRASLRGQLLIGDAAKIEI